MGERREYELSDEQYLELLEVARAVPYMVIGGHAPSSPQENANRVWQKIGREMGFKWTTVQSAPGKSKRHITAEVAPPPKPVKQMTDDDFRLLLDVTMCLDPTPLSDEMDAALQTILIRESEARGYECDTWTVAYHEHQRAAEAKS